MKLSILILTENFLKIKLTATFRKATFFKVFKLIVNYVYLFKETSTSNLTELQSKADDIRF